MSEPIPESVPTSHDPRSKRPTKRLALTPTTQQATQLNALFAKPDRDIAIPSADALSKPRGLAPPPEIVANVQGSSAGAGSGEFHVYKASRRREYERLKMMDAEVEVEKENEKFEKAKEERRRKDEVKTSKNKARREKMKAKKAGKMKDEDGNAAEATQMGNRSSGGGINKAKSGTIGAQAGGDHEATDGAAASVEEVGVIIHDDDD